MFLCDTIHCFGDRTNNVPTARKPPMGMYDARFRIQAKEQPATGQGRLGRAGLSGTAGPVPLSSAAG